MLIALMTMSPVDGARPPRAVSVTAHVKTGGWSGRGNWKFCLCARNARRAAEHFHCAGRAARSSRRNEARARGCGNQGMIARTKALAVGADERVTVEEQRERPKKGRAEELKRTSTKHYTRTRQDDPRTPIYKGASHGYFLKSHNVPGPQIAKYWYLTKATPHSL